MRKALIAAVSTATAVGIVAAAAVGTAAADPSHRHHHGTTFTVVEHAVTDTTADTGPAGDSLGDVLAFANPIYNAADKAKVGTDNGSCIRTAVGSPAVGAYECTWTTTLAGGSLVVSGPFYDAKDSVLAITGGTGKYVGARGQMRLHARDAKGSAYDFAFSLR